MHVLHILQQMYYGQTFVFYDFLFNIFYFIFKYKQYWWELRLCMDAGHLIQIVCVVASLGLGGNKSSGCLKHVFQCFVRLVYQVNAFR
jgi:hypothetical protein